MTISKRYLLAGWLGLWMSHLPAAWVCAQGLPAKLPPLRPAAKNEVQPSEPSKLKVAPGPAMAVAAASSLNQRMADTIAEHLRQCRQLRNYTMDISFQNGIAELAGQVANIAQRDEVLRIVHGVSGVERIRDRLAIREGASVKPAQALSQAPALEPGPLPKPVDNPPANNTLPPEPTPIFQPAPPGTPHPVYQPPRMPPYAWPTYAPYNNYSRVAYPSLYPYQSWPYIGPFYPFPKIPPGWRSIELTWADGCWWYGKKAKSHDWWRIRYW